MDGTPARYNIGPRLEQSDVIMPSPWNIDTILKSGLNSFTLQVRPVFSNIDAFYPIQPC